MKKVLIAVLMLCTPFAGSGGSQPPQQAFDPNTMPPIDPFELLNNMDQKELDKLMEDLAKMSPEEIKYYEELGKQMFKQSGYDLDEIAKSFPAQPTPTSAPTQPAKQPEQKPKPEKPTYIDETSKKERDSLNRMVRALAESLASIRQKAASDETLHPHIAPLHHELDLLTAYVNRFDYEKHLKHFADKEFGALKTKLRKMSSMLEELDNNLFVPELTVRKGADKARSSYQVQMAQATSVIQEFKNYMSRAFTSDLIITDIENLFKKYDQEALGIRKHIEEQQKKAGDQVKNLKPTNTGKFAPIPQLPKPQAKGPQMGTGYTGGGSHQPVSGGGASQPAKTPLGTLTNPNKAGEKGKPGAPAKKGEPGVPGAPGSEGKENKKELEIAEVPLTPQERLKRVEDNLRKANLRVAQNEKKLLQLANELGTGFNNPTPENVAAIKEVTHALRIAKSDMSKLLAETEKDRDPNAAEKMQRQLNAFCNDTLKETRKVYDTFKQTPYPAGPLPEDAQALSEAREVVEAFKKHVADINKELHKTRGI